MDRRLAACVLHHKPRALPDNSHPTCSIREMIHSFESVLFNVLVKSNLKIRWDHKTNIISYNMRTLNKNSDK